MSAQGSISRMNFDRMSAIRHLRVLLVLGAPLTCPPFGPIVWLAGSWGAQGNVAGLRCSAQVRPSCTWEACT